MNKYIKKPLCYSAISALFLTETSIASVYELVQKVDGQLTEEIKDNVILGEDNKIKVDSEEKFKGLVENLYAEETPPTRGQEESAGQQKIRNYNNLPAYLKAGDRVGVNEETGTAEGNHEGNYTPIDSAKHQNKNPSGFYEFDSQMLGAAVWLPDGDEMSVDKKQVYVAKKIDYREYHNYGYKENEQPVAVTTGYDEGTPDSFKERTDVDHTERQLVAAILAEKGLNDNSSGTMCIYTVGAPCRDMPRVNNEQETGNGGICCVSYYKLLATAYPNITFHVYFKKNNVSKNDNIFSRTFRGGYDYLSKILGDKNFNLSITVRGENSDLQRLTISNIEAKKISDLSSLNLTEYDWEWANGTPKGQNYKLPKIAGSLFNEVYNCNGPTNLLFSEL